MHFNACKVYRTQQLHQGMLSNIYLHTTAHGGCKIAVTLGSAQSAAAGDLSHTSRWWVNRVLLKQHPNSTFGYINWCNWNISADLILNGTGTGKACNGHNLPLI